jgi:hypothetical protein
MVFYLLINLLMSRHLIMTWFGVTPHQHLHMGSACSSMSSSCLQGQVRFGGGVLLFILGSNLGGVGPVRGLRGGGRGGWCEEWARSG